jgi:hypothetical protein
MWRDERLVMGPEKGVGEAKVPIRSEGAPWRFVPRFRKTDGGAVAFRPDCGKSLSAGGRRSVSSPDDRFGGAFAFRPETRLRP